MSETNSHVWAFDLGKGGTGDSPVAFGDPPNAPKLRTAKHAEHAEAMAAKSARNTKLEKAATRFRSIPALRIR